MWKWKNLEQIEEKFTESTNENLGMYMKREKLIMERGERERERERENRNFER